MLRALRIIIVIALVATCAALLADRPGSIVIDWLGWKIETSFALALFGVLIFTTAYVVVHQIVVHVRSTPERLARRQAARRRERGLSALTRGLVAAATGELDDARRWGREAERWLEDRTLANLLGAQIAQLSGDDGAAKAYLGAMLASPATELLGLRGLLGEAERRGDRVAALTYATQAQQLHPKAPWAFEARVRLETEAGQWDAAIATLDGARRAGHLTKKAERRWRAVLLTAKATAADHKGDHDGAEAAAAQAHRLMPSFAPASVLAARRLLAKDSAWKAAGILEETWRAAPHPSIVDAYIALKPEESAHERAKRLRGLADMRPDHAESRLLLARQAIKTHRWKEARDALAPLAETTPTARVCSLMAEIEQGETGNIGAAREWLARAVSAPAESEWMRAKFDLSTEEWASLGRLIALDDWPPRHDANVFDKSAVDVAPFAEALKSVTADAEDVDARGEQSTRGRPVVIVAPPPADHIAMGSGGPDTPDPERLARLPDVAGELDEDVVALKSARPPAKRLRGISSARAIKRLLSLATDEPLVSRRRRMQTVPGESDSFEIPQDASAASRAGRPSATSPLTVQPDDPGPNSDNGAVKKGDVPGW